MRCCIMKQVNKAVTLLAISPHAIIWSPDHSSFSMLFYQTNTTRTFNRYESPLSSISFHLENHATTGYHIIEAKQSPRKSSEHQIPHYRSRTEVSVHSPIINKLFRGRSLFPTLFLLRFCVLALVYMFQTYVQVYYFEIKINYLVQHT